MKVLKQGTHVCYEQEDILNCELYSLWTGQASLERGWWVGEDKAPGLDISLGWVRGGALTAFLVHIYRYALTMHVCISLCCEWYMLSICVMEGFSCTTENRSTRISIVYSLCRKKWFLVKQQCIQTSLKLRKISKETSLRIFYWPAWFKCKFLCYSLRQVDQVSMRS